VKRFICDKCGNDIPQKHSPRSCYFNHKEDEDGEISVHLTVEDNKHLCRPCMVAIVSEPQKSWNPESDSKEDLFSKMRKALE
jgi:hypothetical protein